MTETRKSEVNIPIKEGGTLSGTLVVPDAARGLVIFAHGSGSSRLSPRNQFVARVLQEGRLATLLMDLLSEEESEVRQNVFDIELLASRLEQAVQWAREQPNLSELSVGLFGASTGAAAALIAAAKKPTLYGAVVSRGGRADLANTYLSKVTAPTLLIVGGDDDVVLALNEGALEKLTCEKKLTVIAGATHLFEEPGTLEKVADFSRDWFSEKLKAQEGKVVKKGRVA